MGERLRNYINKLEERSGEKKPATAAECEEILVQIGFFQHERLIHLLVTLAFAIFAIGTLFVYLFLEQIPLLILFFMFMILLVPYIRHYYLLENGCQKLYVLYDKIKNIY